jgi:exonuclease VII small subunit
MVNEMTVSKVLNETISNLSKQETQAITAVNERAREMKAAQSNLAETKELEMCADRENQQSRKELDEFREYVNNLENEERTPVLFKTLNDLTLKQSQASMKWQESTQIVGQCQDKLNLAQNRLAISTDQLKAIRIKKTDASKHLLGS